MAGMAGLHAREMARKRWAGTTPEARSAAGRARVAKRWAKRAAAAESAEPTALDHAAALLASMPATRQFVWWRERLPELVSLLQSRPE